MLAMSLHGMGALLGKEIKKGKVMSLSNVATRHWFIFLRASRIVFEQLHARGCRIWGDDEKVDSYILLGSVRMPRNY